MRVFVQPRSSDCEGAALFHKRLARTKQPLLHSGSYVKQLRIRFATLLCLLLVYRLDGQDIRSWTTTEDLGLRFHEEKGTVAPTDASPRVIKVAPSRTFQTILGIGASFEHTTCSNLFRITAAERERAIERLVSPSAGVNMNLMRICIGTSDFAGEAWYSYNDLPKGETDPELRQFSIERDRAYILPVLKIARQKNPELIFFASPWSPPGWMKTSGTMIGGELLAKYYPVYAKYFVRFIQAYEAEGIPIYAVTVQNEPGVDRLKGDPKWHYPSCHWTAEQERDFIRDHLGPAFRAAGLKTKIWCYDHNYNVEPKKDSAGLNHPRSILRDARAAGFVDGVGFHHYEGEPSGMTLFHEEFPNKPIHFTEGSVFGIFGGHDLIERFRNWAVSYNAWVTVLDEAGRPNNGPFPATIAILRLDSPTGRIRELLEFYNYAHFSKFVQRGAKRIESTLGNAEFNNIAFLNPDNSIVSILVNTSTNRMPAVLQLPDQKVAVDMPPRSIRTYSIRR
jgi:glucosylceramidase